MDRLSLFGIRHHGPGCARSLVGALDELDPGIVLIEGPPEAASVLPYAADPGMVPPVALLLYDSKFPSASLFIPFAEYSPEWQALRWALRHDRPVRFIDLPVVWTLADIKAREEQRKQDEAAAAEEPAQDAEIPAEGEPDADAGTQEPDEEPTQEVSLQQVLRHDPLGALALVAGHHDGDAWWSELVEEQTHAPSLFSAIELALAAVREAAEEELDGQEHPLGPEEELREQRREAHMRLEVAKALDETEGPVAAIVGAWHVPALRRKSTKTNDRKLIRKAPRIKVESTWIPWTHTRLAKGGGYGAGVRSPGWYTHLWRHSENPDATAEDLATGWALRAASLLRERGDIVSTAGVIEVTRLAVAMAALRGVATPGFDDLREALVATLCSGEAAQLASIGEALYIGGEVGKIGSATPQNPLQLDLERQQRSLRLKPLALQKPLSLDLRSRAGRAKSTLLHRLQLLGIPWGQLASAGRSRGTFRENWTLEWAPEFSVALAEAMVYGTTVEAAAAGKARETAQETTDLARVAELVRQCLLADLELVAREAIDRLQKLAAASTDIAPLMEAVPPLVEVLRYGEARQTPEEALKHLIGNLNVQVCSSLHYACRQLQEQELEQTRNALEGMDRALVTQDDEEQLGLWVAALGRLAGDGMAMPKLRGFAQRRLYDRAIVDQEETAAALSRALSPSHSPLDAGEWLEGFIALEGQVLLADEQLRGLIDDWLSELEGGTFLEALPMLRRAFASLAAAERKLLMGRLFGDRQGTGVAAVGLPAIDEEGLALFHDSIPLLKTILGSPEGGKA